MLTARQLRFPLATAIALACATAGCATDEQAATDPTLDGLSDAPAGKSDGYDPVAALYQDRARTWAEGIVQVESGTTVRGTLTYELPDAGADLVSAWIDDTDGLGIPDGFATDLAVFKLHKPATQHGWLRVTGGNDVAVYLVRRVVGAASYSSVYVNRRPVDAGNPDLDVNYTVLVGPAVGHGGTGTQSFSGIKLSIVDE